MKKRKKILHINSYYNGSTFYKNFYDLQVKSDMLIDVFIPAYKVYKNNNNFGEYANISINHKKWHRFFFYLKQKKIIKDLYNKYILDEYDIIHAHSLFTNGNVALNIYHNFDIPYIVAVRNTDVNVFFSKMIHLRKKGIKILVKAHKIVFLSKLYRDLVINSYVPEKFKDYILNKSVIIPNGIDDFWHKNKGEVKILKKKNKINLLFVGNIDRNKNLITTLKAVEKLNILGYDVLYTVVGRIVNKNIYNVISKSKLVKYISPIPREELISIYRNNDIFIMPSVNETFGLVYPEAMSQGLPVVYSKNQGFDGQFEEGHVGYGVNSMCSDDIVDAVKKICDDYTSISQRAIESCKQFKWEDVSEQYELIYTKTLDGEGDNDL